MDYKFGVLSSAPIVVRDGKVKLTMIVDGDELDDDIA